MPQSEFRSWLAEYELEPFGERRADLRAALIAWTVASVFSKKGHQPDINSFLLDFETKLEQVNEEQSKKPQITAQQMQAIFGGTISKKQ